MRKSVPNFSTMTTLSKSLIVIICILLVFQVRSVFIDSNLDPTMVSVAHLFLISTAAITFLSWIYQTNKRLQLKYASTMKFTSGWSVGWFLVPVAFLWKQYQVLNEIWRMSQGGSSAGLAFVGWWHGLYIISNQLSWRVVTNVLNSEAGSPRANTTEFVSNSFDVILSLMTIMLVYKISVNTAKTLES
jgi:hypothetical protein